MHGGTGDALSGGIGQGSEFVVRLPIVVETPPVSAAQPGGFPALTARRVLVVDDNRDSAMSLALLLKLAGNETHTAFDGLSAVEAAEKYKPDLVLMDIGLPKLNGYEACRRIRQQSWGKNMILVALTGWGQDEDKEKSRTSGFSGHLVKPAELETLAKLLADVQQRVS
jgi:CheY-like chemotaxis protein